MKRDTKKLTTIAMMCALAYIVMFVARIPDPKDVVIAIGGFLFGPLTSFVISAVVSLVEMFTVSETGFWGLLMNILSSCSFACTAAFLYKKRHNRKGAVIGLISGVAAMVAVMMLWNYLITPIYMGYPRAAVAELLLPAFLPFNLLKGGLNAAITILLYKPVVTALRKAGLAPESKGDAGAPQGSLGVTLAALMALVTCVLLVLVMKGVI